MKLTILITGALAVLSLPAANAIAEKPADAKAVEQEIVSFEKDRLAAFARADKEVFADMMADDVTVTHGYGEVFNKAQEMAVMRPSTPERPLPALSIENTAVKSYGDDTAVLTGSLVETARDGRRELVLRFTNTYVKQEEHWRMVAGQLTTLSRERAIAKLDPKIYDTYVGQYKNPAGRLLTVSNEGEKLMVEVAGDKVQLLPESETQFFMKEADVLLAFVKDDQGKVVRLINRRPNGDIAQEVKVK